MLASYRPGLATLACLLVCLGGCNASKKTTKVSGTVTFEGKNLVYGTVTMVGEDNVSRNGAIQKDGKYTVEDVPFGQVRVAVFSKDPASRQVPKKSPPPGAQVPKQADTPVQIEGWFPIPDDYNSVSNSGLSFTVDQENMNHNITLTPK
jgi:hypothetical protein